MHFFQPKTSKRKGTLVFFDPDSGDKKPDFAQIE